jgi:PKD repeat protein
MIMKIKFPIILLYCLISFVFAQNTGADYKSGQLYLKFREDLNLQMPNDLLESSHLALPQNLVSDFAISSANKAFPQLDYKPMESAFRIVFQDTARWQVLLNELKALPGVAYCERVPEYYSQLTPNDPSFSPSTTTQWGLYKIRAQQAWDITTGNPNVLVAVVDDAVKLNHQDMIANLWTNPNEIPGNGIDDDGNGYIDDVNGWDSADNDPDANPPGTATNTNFSHGTHCAGIVAAATNNALGVASIGFNTSYIPIKGKESATSGSSIQAAMEGVVYALNTPARIISMSWGGSGSSSVEQLIYDYAHQRGIILIAAAGNNGNQTPFYPANYNNVMAIGNTTTTDARSSSSNFGTWIDLMAPGTNIFNCVAGSVSAYANKTGTSMACPMVAGTAALMLAVNPGLTPDMVYQCLKDSADNINAQNTTIVGLIGAGRLNAQRAVRCAVNGFKPIARFSENNNNVCTGTPIDFIDHSWGSPTTYNWTFQGGTPATSNLPNPQVTWNTAGTYTVRLIVSNLQGADTLEIVNHIIVNGASQALPFSEDFESNDFATNSWFIHNPDSIFTWEIVTTGGNPLGGSRSAKIDFYNYPFKGSKDGMVTPAFDLTPYSSVKMGYSRAFRNATTLTDSLIVRVSTDCGVTFPHVLYAQGGAALRTFTSSNAEFTPSINAHWCGATSQCDTLQLNAFLTQPNVRIKFESVNQYGNNLYLDNIQITGVPKSDFSAPLTSICLGQTIQFQENATGGATTYSWSFPGATPATANIAQPSVTYNTAGTYQVSLTVSNIYGAHTETKTAYIIVGGGIPVTLTSPIALYCNTSAPVTLLANPSGGLLSGPGTSGTQFNPTLAGVGTHRLFYQYTDPLGCGGIDSLDITVMNSTPGSIAGLVSPVCQDVSPYTLVGTPSGGSFSGNGMVGNQFRPSVAGLGTHQIQYQYTDISGCVGLTNATVQVNAPGVATFNNPQTLCKNDLPLTLSATPGGGNFSGVGITANTMNPTNLAPGNYTFSYQYTSNGCQGSANGSIQVLPIPAVSLSSPTTGPWCNLEPAFPLSFAPAGGVLSGTGLTGTSFDPNVAGPGAHLIEYSVTGINGCAAKAQITLNVTLPPVPLILQGSFLNICGNGFLSVAGTGSYQWFLNGNPIPGANTNTYIPTQSGVFTVLQTMNICSGTSAPIQVNYQPQAIANFTTAINGMTVSFTNNSQNTNTHTWSFGDGNTSTAVSPVHTYASPGAYTVSLVSNTGQCADTETQVVILMTTQHHDDLSSTPFIVYPNPAEDILYIQTPASFDADQLKAEIFDLSGKLLQAEQLMLSNHSGSIALQLPQGIYLLQLSAASGITYTHRVTVR